MASQAAFPFVLDAGRARRRPCTGFCAGTAVAEEASHPFQSLLHPCLHRWLPATGRDWRSCCCSWSLGRRATQGSRDKRRQAYRSGSWLLARGCHGGSRGPLCPGQSARPVSRQPSHFGGFTLPLFFLGVFLFHVSFCTAWRPHCVRSFRLHMPTTAALRRSFPLG